VKKRTASRRKREQARRGGQLDLPAVDGQPWERLATWRRRSPTSTCWATTRWRACSASRRSTRRRYARRPTSTPACAPTPGARHSSGARRANTRRGITEHEYRELERSPHTLAAWQREEIARLRAQYGFFHWHLAFPDVFRLPSRDEDPTNGQAGWSGGFDVVLGNPPWERIKLQELEFFCSA